MQFKGGIRKKTILTQLHKSILRNQLQHSDVGIKYKVNNHAKIDDVHVRMLCVDTINHTIIAQLSMSTNNIRNVSNKKRRKEHVNITEILFLSIRYCFIF